MSVLWTNDFRRLFRKSYIENHNLPIVNSTGMADLIVQSAVKDHLANHNVAADFYDALDGELKELLEDAAERAEANDRKTVQSRDL